ncbi:yippee-like protein [Nymphaea thermarum]|nr:yippee-like protein [Nymphaea thermarum]
MGRLYLSQLSGQFYCCKTCHCPLAYIDDIVSRTFQSRRGKAYLFESVVNVTVGILEDKLMLTGLHTVADIYCNSCHQLLGWKYEKAYSKAQMYKEGKFILERDRIEHGDGSISPEHSDDA